MPFKSVGSLLTKSNLGRNQLILAMQVRQVAASYLREMLSEFGEEVSGSTRVISYRNGVLLIGCPRLVAVELKTRSEGLIDNINHKFRGKIITAVKFKTS